MTTRTELLNFLINEINAKKYLEIGVEYGGNFANVRCEHKTGVDPDYSVATLATHHMTSDDFFKNNAETFDVIFIDGLHHCDQVYRDVINSMKFLNEGGYIVCHDMNPLDEILQIVPRPQPSWCGDCWKAWVKLRFENSILNMRILELCSGCGVIDKSEPTPIPDLALPNDDYYKLPYSFLNQNRKLLLNLVTVDEFLSTLK